MQLTQSGLQRRPRQNLAKQRGISLVEVLVTILIMSIGLLGHATLQNVSMKFSYDSYLRTQASFLAYDLIDRIRANPDAELYLISENASLTAPGDCFSGDDCSVAQLRDFDLYYWQQQVQTLMPDATTEVVYDFAQDLYSLKIKWDDRIDNDDEEDQAKEFVYHFKVID